MTATKTEFPSLVEIKRQIPAHLFESNTLVSLFYFARIYFCIAALAYAFYLAKEKFEPTSVEIWALRLVYWFLCGTCAWGVFTLGHDCGHSSFSRFDSLNWIAGNILHSSLLVPYESWRITHRHHHKNTGSIHNDEIFMPVIVDDALKKKVRFWGKDMDDVAIGTWLKNVRGMIWSLGFAWWAYLLVGYTPRNVHHFVGWTRTSRILGGMFGWSKEDEKMWARHIPAVVGSISIWCCFAAATVYSINKVGYFAVLDYYLMPLFVFSSWLVIVTFLHHNEEDTVWYGDSEWNYVKGNLSSIDRSYWPFDSITHNIGTHQIHHLFPKIPHYKLNEATAHFKKAFPHLFRSSPDGIISAFSKNAGLFVEYGEAPSGVEMYSWREARAQGN